MTLIILCWSVGLIGCTVLGYGFCLWLADGHRKAEDEEDIGWERKMGRKENGEDRGWGG